MENSASSGTLPTGDRSNRKTMQSTSTILDPPPVSSNGSSEHPAGCPLDPRYDRRLSPQAGALGRRSRTCPRASSSAIVGPNGAGKSTLIKAVLDSGAEGVGARAAFTASRTRSSAISSATCRSARAWIGISPSARSMSSPWAATARSAGSGRSERKHRDAALAALERVGMAEYRAPADQPALRRTAAARLPRPRAGAGREPLLHGRAVRRRRCRDRAGDRRLLQDLRTRGKNLPRRASRSRRPCRSISIDVILLNMRVVAAGPTKEVFTSENLHKTYGGSSTCSTGRRVWRDCWRRIHGRPDRHARTTSFDIVVLLRDYNTRASSSSAPCCSASPRDRRRVSAPAQTRAHGRRALPRHAAGHRPRVHDHASPSGCPANRCPPAPRRGDHRRAGLLTMLAIRSTTRLKEDAALGIVLSVFFGRGVAVLGWCRTWAGRERRRAGIVHLRQDRLDGRSATRILIACRRARASACGAAVQKEFTPPLLRRRLRARAGLAGGRPRRRDDGAGHLSSPSSACKPSGSSSSSRCSSFPPRPRGSGPNRLDFMLLLSALIGALSGWLGASFSGIFSDLPAGAIIVSSPPASSSSACSSAPPAGSSPLARPGPPRAQGRVASIFSAPSTNSPRARSPTRCQTLPSPVRQCSRMRSWSPRELPEDSRPRQGRRPVEESRGGHYPPHGTGLWRSRPRHPQPPALGALPHQPRRHRPQPRRSRRRHDRARPRRRDLSANWKPLLAATTGQRLPRSPHALELECRILNPDSHGPGPPSTGPGSLVTGMLCAMSCALPGPFLVLRKMSMMGDAISHAVLPGLAVAFFITSSRDSLPMFIGAAVVGVLTALFTQWISGFGKVDEGAAMGVVFTALFAHRPDPDRPRRRQRRSRPRLRPLRRHRADPARHESSACELSRAPSVNWHHRLLVNLGIVALLFKELQISSFDPALADHARHQRPLHALPAHDAGRDHRRRGV